MSCTSVIVVVRCCRTSSFVRIRTLFIFLLISQHSFSIVTSTFIFVHVRRRLCVFVRFAFIRACLSAFVVLRVRWRNIDDDFILFILFIENNNYKLRNKTCLLFPSAAAIAASFIRWVCTNHLKTSRIPPFLTRFPLFDIYESLKYHWWLMKIEMLSCI